MHINVTPLVPVSVNDSAVNSAVQACFINTEYVYDYEKNVATDRDKVFLMSPGAQGDETIEILLNTNGANDALDEVGESLANLPFARFTCKTFNGFTKDGSRIMGNILYILDRTTADSEADVFCWRWSGGRVVLDSWVIDTSAEALITTLQRTDAGAGTIS